MQVELNDIFIDLLIALLSLTAARRLPSITKGKSLLYGLLKLI